MSDYADTGTSREGDPYAEIAALRQRVAELERELEGKQESEEGEGEMKPFSQKSKCRKCGSKEVAAHWHGPLGFGIERWNDLHRVADLPESDKVDFILRRCERCHFQWAEKTLEEPTNEK